MEHGEDLSLLSANTSLASGRASHWLEDDFRMWEFRESALKGDGTWTLADHRIEDADMRNDCIQLHEAIGTEEERIDCGTSRSCASATC